MATTLAEAFGHCLRYRTVSNTCSGGSSGCSSPNLLGEGNFRIRLRDEAWASPIEGMDYYSDDYPDTPLEEFLAVYERLTKYAQREVHDLAESLVATIRVTEGDGRVDRVGGQRFP